MPRPPRQNSPATPLSHGQSHYVLERMIAERRISPGEVARYVSEMGREITDLEQRLQRLREAHGGSGGGAAAPARRGPGRPAGSGRGPGRPAGSGRGPGRPAGSGRGPGRPAGSGAKAGAGAGASSQGANAQGGGAGAAKSGGAKRGRKRSNITPEQLASRQLQGRYLALVRQFPENRRAGYAKTAKEKGREAAIKEMQESLKK